MTQAEPVRRLIDRTENRHPFQPRELFGEENLFVAAARAVANGGANDSQLHAALVKLQAQVDADASNWNRDGDAGISWTSLPPSERVRHRALLQGFVQTIGALNVRGPGVESAAALQAADGFTQAWPIGGVSPASHLQRRGDERPASDPLYASVLDAFGESWTPGMWTFWDFVQALRAGRKTASSPASERTVTRTASVPVLLYVTSTGYAELASLCVELDLGEQGDFLPSPLDMGVTLIRRMPDRPDGSSLAHDPDDLDFLASMRRAWQVAGLAGLPVRGRWWIASYDPRRAAALPRSEPLTIPILEGRSCEAAACCALWAAYGGIPSQGRLHSSALRLDDERPISATIGPRDAHGFHQLGLVGAIDRKAKEARRRGLAGPVLVADSYHTNDNYVRPVSTLDSAFQSLLSMNALRDAHAKSLEADWNKNWANVPFIGSQKLKLLVDLDTPQLHLRTEAFKARRDEQGAEGKRPSGANEPWRELDRTQLVTGVATIDGREHSLRRIFITSDAGMGKSTTVEWLEKECQAAEEELLAVRLSVKDLESVAQAPLIPEADDADQSAGLLVERLTTAEAVTPFRKSGEAAAFLRRLREQGRLVLLCDGLDEVTATSPSVGVLATMTRDDSAWRHCRIVVAGRPYAITTLWNQLFTNDSATGWRFVLVDEFTAEEQKAYLGTGLYERVPQDARAILTVPRVLRYLRQYVAHPEKIGSASDVYWTAVRRIISEGLDAGVAGGGRAAGTQQGGVALDLKDALLLLSAFAFELTVDRGEFNAVPCDDWLISAVASSCQLYRSSFTPPGRPDVTAGVDWVQWVKDRLPLLAATNGPFKHDLIDHGCPETLQFRNRSLQEFFTAFWMSNYCLEDQVETLKTRLPLAHDPASQAWYWTFRFAAEMPDGALDAPTAKARNDQRWVRAMSAVFCRGDGTAAGTKRASEMIARAWPTLYDHYVVAKQNPDARKLVEHWRSEFQEKFVDQGDAFAKELTESFVKIPGGTLKMGSTKKDTMRYDDEPEELEIPIEEFQICRFPMLNGFYRLYDPGHGIGKRDQARNWWSNESYSYQDISPSERHPVIDVSWWDARASSLWFRWKDKNGRFVEATLPNEAQHEWVAKDCPLPGQPYRPYWWGGEFPSEHCHSRAQRTAEVPKWTEGMKHPRLTPNGRVFDITGNVWQWCLNVYREGGPSRSVRGGSWRGVAPRSFRAALRLRYEPGDRNDSLGFRLALVRSG